MRVLLTGAAGEIGRDLRAGLAGRYELLRLTDLAPLAPAGAGEETIHADLADAGAVAKAVKGMDAILHLGGVSRESDWTRLLSANVAGTVNIFEEARRAGLRRVIYASSNHVIGYHRAQRRVTASEPVRPDTRYGVTKAFGEALGRYMADKHGMEVVCLRIGSYRQQVTATRELATWLSPGDMLRLAVAALEAPDVHFEVVYGVSANTRRSWGADGAQRIGYEPRDDAEAYAGTARDIRPSDVPAANDGFALDDLFHGGFYAALDCVSDPRRID